MDKYERMRLIIDKVVEIVKFVQKRQEEELVTLISSQLYDLLEDLL